MDDRFGLKVLNDGCGEIVVADVTDAQVDSLASHLVPAAQPLGQRLDRRQRLDGEFVVPLAADKVIDDGDRMSFAGKIQSRGPTAITVATENGNPHASSRSAT